MTVHLHWEDLHSPPAPGAEGPHRWAAYNSVHEALEQAVAVDGLTPNRITDEAGDVVLVAKDAIAQYAAAKADLDAKRAAKLAAAEEAHQKALAAAAGA